MLARQTLDRPPTSALQQMTRAPGCVRQNRLVELGGFAMQRRFAFGFGVTAGVLLLLGAGAGAQTVTVTDCADQTGLATAMNTVPSGGTIVFDCGSTPANPVTIPVTATLEGGATNYTMDGGGAVILAGSGPTPGPMLEFPLNGQTATVQNLTVTGSTGSADGAIKLAGGSNVTLVNMTIFNNAAIGASGRGGGLYVQNSTATIVNSTFSGNSATQVGNDIESDGGTVNMANSIFLDGCFNNGGTFNDLGGNVDTGSSCTSGANGSLINVATPILGPLAEGLFFPLAAGSVAIGLDTANCPARDELGNSRGSTCNAGAVQVNTPPFPVPALGPAALCLSALLLGAVGWAAVRRA